MFDSNVQMKIIQIADVIAIRKVSVYYLCFISEVDFQIYIDLVPTIHEIDTERQVPVP